MTCDLSGTNLLIKDAKLLAVRFLNEVEIEREEEILFLKKKIEERTKEHEELNWFYKWLDSENFKSCTEYLLSKVYFYRYSYKRNEEKLAKNILAAAKYMDSSYPWVFITFEEIGMLY